MISPLKGLAIPHGANKADSTTDTSELSAVATQGKHHKVGNFAEALAGLIGKKSEDEEKSVAVAPAQTFDLKTAIAHAAQLSLVTGQAAAQAQAPSAGGKLIATVLTKVSAAGLDAGDPLHAQLDEALTEETPELLVKELAAKIDAPKVETTQAPAAAQPVFKSELVDAIAKHVVAETPKVEIVVQPPELGRVHVTVEMRQNEVHVRVVAENQEVNKSLSDRLPELQQTLREQGMRVGSIDVGMQTTSGEAGDFSQSRSASGNPSGSGGQASQSDTRDRDRGDLAVASESKPTTTKPGARNKRGLDVVA